MGTCYSSAQNTSIVSHLVQNKSQRRPSALHYTHPSYLSKTSFWCFLRPLHGPQWPLCFRQIVRHVLPLTKAQFRTSLRSVLKCDLHWSPLLKVRSTSIPCPPTLHSLRYFLVLFCFKFWHFLIALAKIQHTTSKVPSFFPPSLSPLCLLSFLHWLIFYFL